jgi:hypothetical protein
VLLDTNFKPWLLEVNHTPSLKTDTPLDKLIKSHLILDTLNLINVRADDRRNTSMKHFHLPQRADPLSGYKLIYPSIDNEHTMLLQSARRLQDEIDGISGRIRNKSDFQ